MDQTTTIELNALTDQSTNDNSRTEIEPTSSSELPPVDGGRDAWIFVFGSFVLETFVWGFGFTYGVFQNWYLHHPPFNAASETAISAIGTSALAIQYMEVLFVIIIAQKWPHRVNALMWSALVLCCGSLFLSSFATKVWHLIALQGVLFGVGGGFLYAPVIIWLSEWFVRRRGLAGSIIFGGSGMGGAVFPVIANTLLESVGFAWTLRIWAAFMAILTGISLLGTKPRLPITHGSQRRSAPVDLNFIKDPLFPAVAATIFVQALGYFPVSLYMPNYTSSLGLSLIHGTLVLSVFNIASVVGQVIFGHLCDKAPYTRVMIGSGIFSALSAYLLWGFAHNLGTTFVFVVVFGSLSGGFSSIWPAAATEIAGTSTSSGIVFGCFGATKGVAAIIGPIIAASLHRPHESQIKSTYGGYGFTGVTLFVGGMMAVTTAGSVASWLLKSKRLHHIGA